MKTPHVQRPRQQAPGGVWAVCDLSDADVLGVSVGDAVAGGSASFSDEGAGSRAGARGGSSRRAELSSPRFQCAAGHPGAGDCF